MSAYDYVAAVGLAGTGKSSFVQALVAQTQWPVIYFGGQVLAEVKARGLAITPDNERLVREDIRARHGPAAMAILALNGIDLARTPARATIIDGLYSDAELLYLRERLGTRLMSVAIHASFERRVERLAARPMRPLSRSQVIARDRAEIDNIGKAPPIALADHHFVNDGEPAALEAFAAQIARMGQG